MSHYRARPIPNYPEKNVTPAELPPIPVAPLPLKIVPTPYSGPVPRVGQTVTYYPRPGDWRAGRNEFAAIVTQVRPGGLLDLVLIHDADDFQGLKAVAPRLGMDLRGWEMITGTSIAESDIRDDLDVFKAKAFKAMYGNLDAPNEGLLEIMAEFEMRLAAVEARRGPGRPKAEKKD